MHLAEKEKQITKNSLFHLESKMVKFCVIQSVLQNQINSSTQLILMAK